MHMGNRLAAVDLGSNSFRLEIGRLEHGDFLRTEYLKETVRQGGGLDDERNLTPQAMQAGWDCLARFGERLSGFKPTEVRAVATQTLREARNRDVFLERANTILGFPINIISGREEARLIYQGVAHMLPPSDERRIVIKIGSSLVADSQAACTKTAWMDALARDIPRGLYLGHLTVADATARVAHQEHAALELPHGTYRVRRQRELDPEEARVVAD